EAAHAWPASEAAASAAFLRVLRRSCGAWSARPTSPLQDVADALLKEVAGLEPGQFAVWTFPKGNVGAVQDTWEGAEPGVAVVVHRSGEELLLFPLDLMVHKTAVVMTESVAAPQGVDEMLFGRESMCRSVRSSVQEAAPARRPADGAQQQQQNVLIKHRMHLPHQPLRVALANFTPAVAAQAAAMMSDLVRADTVTNYVYEWLLTVLRGREYEGAMRPDLWKSLDAGDRQAQLPELRGADPDWIAVKFIVHFAASIMQFSSVVAADYSIGPIYKKLIALFILWRLRREHAVLLDLRQLPGDACVLSTYKQVDVLMDLLRRMSRKATKLVERYRDDSWTVRCHEICHGIKLDIEESQQHVLRHLQHVFTLPCAPPEPLPAAQTTFKMVTAFLDFAQNSEAMSIKEMCQADVRAPTCASTFRHFPVQQALQQLSQWMKDGNQECLAPQDSVRLTSGVEDYIFDLVLARGVQGWFFDSADVFDRLLDCSAAHLVDLARLLHEVVTEYSCGKCQQRLHFPEQHSRSALLLFACSAMLDAVTRADPDTRELMSRYAPALDAEPLQHLLLPDRRLMEVAARLVTYFAEVRTSGPQLFNMDGAKQEYTLQFALEYASQRKPEWWRRMRDAAQAKDRVYKKEVARCERAESELRAKLHDLSVLRSGQPLCSVRWCNSCQWHVLGREMSNIEDKLRSVEKQPPTLVHPLPSDPSGAQQVLFFM
ncbi:unnamed protein product, partial [Prorocentrum cordatum]